MDVLGVDTRLRNRQEYDRQIKFYSDGDEHERIDVYVDTSWWDARRATELWVHFMKPFGLNPHSRAYRVKLGLREVGPSRATFEPLFAGDGDISTGAYLPLVAFDSGVPQELILLLWGQ